MASIYRKTIVRPLPENAVVTNGKVSWTTRHGRKRTGTLVETPTGNKVRFKGDTWHVKYTNAQGQSVRESTGCRTKEPARAKMAQIVRTVELIKGGIITASEARAAEYRNAPLDSLLTAYAADLSTRPGKGKRDRITEQHVADYLRFNRRIAAECGFTVLADVDRERVRNWVNDILRERERGLRDWSNRNINAHVSALGAFLNWCVDTGKITNSPLTNFRLLSNSPKNPRRALTEEELTRLLKAGLMRPVAEYGREVVTLEPKPGKRSSWTRKPLTFGTLDECFERGKEALRGNPATLRALIKLGEERRLIYSVLVTTGLRRGELESINVSDFYFAEQYIDLDAQDEKSGLGAKIPLRSDIADQLRQWVDTHRLKPDDRVLRVPDKLIRILDRDLLAADIPKIDERGRRIVVHSTRNTLATMLNRAGVAPRVVQEAMRHSDIRLTMQTYTDANQLDVGSALNALPQMGRDASEKPQQKDQ